MVNNINRRELFRIYEKVNLLYKKIDLNEVAVTQPVSHKILDDDYQISVELDGVGPNLPLPGMDKNWPADADFKGNNPQNINLSASGIAFTCEDSFKEGDYLAMKIMPTFCIKDILTYAKVVYCTKCLESESQYSSFIGAHFVSMKNEDKALLLKHVDKKKLQKTWINGFILAIVLIVIAAPGAIFGLLFELFHFLLELFLEFSHLGFEFIESNLDHLIEHLFETDLHQTQIVVFYIIFSVVVFGLYRLRRIFPAFYLRCKKNQLAYWSRKKASLNYFWREQSLINKIWLVVIGTAIITGYIFFGM
jgi:hypothetical protein